MFQQDSQVSDIMVVLKEESGDRRCPETDTDVYFCLLSETFGTGLAVTNMNQYITNMCQVQRGKAEKNHQDLFGGKILPARHSEGS